MLFFPVFLSAFETDFSPRLQFLLQRCAFSFQVASHIERVFELLILLFR